MAFLKSLILFTLFSSSCLAVTLEEMSVDEKVGQLLMVHFHGSEVNEEAKALIADVKVGGIIYYPFSNGLHSKQEVRRLSCDLQSLASIPLLIASDEEGGVVSRVQGLTQFPGNGALGSTL